MIPRARETDEQRKMRVMSEEIEHLRELVEQKSDLQICNSVEEGPPLAIGLAFDFIHDFRVSTMPQPSRDGVCREATTDELMAIGSACELLTDFFDGHNVRLQRARKGAIRKWKK